MEQIGKPLKLQKQLGHGDDPERAAKGDSCDMSAVPGADPRGFGKLPRDLDAHPLVGHPGACDGDVLWRHHNLGP